MKRLILTLAIFITLSSHVFSELTADEKEKLAAVFEAYHRHTNQIHEANKTIDFQAEVLGIQSNLIAQQDIKINHLEKKQYTARKKRVIRAVIVVTNIASIVAGFIVGRRL